MRCPYCAHPESRVTDSREAEDGIRRRRECLECGQRFSTFERLALGTLFVIKRDGRREPFSREKLLSGLRKACEKRPLPIGAIEAMAADIEATLTAMGVAEVPSAEIGALVMDRLRDLDPIAYIRFASVYRRFADLDELRSELDMLAQPRRSVPGVDQLPLFDPSAVGGLRPLPTRRRRGRPPRTEHRPAPLTTSRRGASEARTASEP